MTLDTLNNGSTLFGRDVNMTVKSMSRVVLISYLSNHNTIQQFYKSGWGMGFGGM